MRISINPNEEEVIKIRKAIEKNDGYCPCQLEKTDKTKCMCANFISDPNPGWCHCGLYLKTFDD